MRIVFLVLWVVSTVFATGAGAQERTVHHVRIDGAIGVGTTAFIDDVLSDAAQKRVALVVFEMDTPGGLVAATREIIKKILASPVPVAVFVAPSGARAASAGTFIAYAAHFVGMAPGTHLGAATPVQMTMPGLPGGTTPKPQGEGDKKKPAGQSAMERKVLNDAIASIRSLAQLRGRSVEWAEKFVRDAATLTAREALKEGLIDVVADDLSGFLKQIDGRSTKTPKGEVKLAVAGGNVETIAPSWKVKFLTAITNPNVAFILLLIGVYGIIFEFWSPGLTGPGVIGAVCLIIGLFALSVLPLSYAGLALLLLGLALMVAEGLAPGFGILGIGGVAAFIVGAIFLFDPEGADFELEIYRPLVIAAAATSALLLIGMLGYLLRSRNVKVVSGSEQMIGLEGRVVSWSGQTGRVRVHGEIWLAVADKALAAGDVVRVDARDGLTLSVHRIAEGDAA